MMKYLKNYRIILFFSFILVAVYSIATIRLSVFSKDLIDDIIMPILNSGTRDFTILKNEICKLGIVLAVAVLTATLSKFSFTYIANSVIRDLKKSMFSKIENLPMSYYAKSNKGEIVSFFTNDANNIQEMITGPLENFFSAFLLFTLSIGTMATISINLLIMYLVYIVVAMFLLTEFVKKTNKPYKDMQYKMASYSGYLKESFSGYKEIKAYGCSDYVKNKLKKIITDISEIEIFTGETTFAIANIINTIFDFLFVLIAICGTLFSYFKLKNYFCFSTSTFTVGIILSFLLLINNTKSAFIKVYAQINKVFPAKASIERIDALFAEPIDVKTGENKNIDTVSGKVVFDNVSFSYDGIKPILSDININVEKGMKVGIVGTTGAGKTTLVNLFDKCYKGYSGEIYIDDINIKDIKNIHEFVSSVLQETYLFSGTVLENIRYGRDDATDDECFEAARLVGADKIIEMLQDGYNTKLENAGANLSEGQRQLIALARTALSKSKIIILDEATSSIDVMTEKIVKEGLNKLMQGRTSITIAHRLSTIEGSNLIIVMKNGKIIESGTHEALIDKNGEYYQLYQGNLELS